MGGPGSGRVSEKWTPALLEALADELDAWTERKGSLWLKDFCRSFDIPTRDFEAIFSRTEKSKRAYERAKDWQESLLIKGGLLKKFDSSFTKFVLSNAIGWSERKRIEGELGFLLQEVDGKTKSLLDD